ncbi:hypothetical protein [Bradyrhizobium embrapense]
MTDERHCDHCGAAFIPREAKVRFCSPQCNREWWSAERSKALAFYRQQQPQEEEQAS